MEVEDAKIDKNTEKEERREVVEEAHFFQPSQFSEGGEEILNMEEIEEHKVEFEQKLQEFLKVINDETLQLSEFLMEEDRLIKELCSSLKQILKKFKVSFNIPSKGLPIKTKVKRAILNEECHLIIVYEMGEVHSAFLSEYPPEIVMATLLAIMPELAKVIRLYRKKVSARTSFFGRIKKELKNVAKAIVGSVEGMIEKETMDAVENSRKSESRED